MFGSLNYVILQFDMCIGNSASEKPVKCQGDRPT